MTMRVKVTFVALMMGASFALPTPAAADRVTVTFGPYQAGPGGEFTLTPYLPTTAGWLDLSSYSLADGTRGIDSFQTFCIEKNEYINTANYDAAISPYAINGGAGPKVDIDGAGPSTVLGDPVSKGTGWLYSKFASGGLDDYGVVLGYDYSASGRLANASLLQAAFWMLEHEQGWDVNNKFIKLLLANSGLTTQEAAKADGGADYGVSAINLWKIDDPNDEKQSQLYYKAVPDGGMTLMLLGMTLGGLAALRRRFPN